MDLLDHFARLKGIVDAKSRRETVDALLQRVNLARGAQAAASAASPAACGSASASRRRCSAIPSSSSSTSPPPASIPEERVRFHNLLADIAADVIVILSTHIVSDVADLCGQLAVIIDGGRVLLTGEPDALRAPASRAASGARSSTRREAEAHQGAGAASCRRGCRRASTVVRAYPTTAPPAPGFEPVRGRSSRTSTSARSPATSRPGSGRWRPDDGVRRCWPLRGSTSSRRLRMVSTYVYFVLFAVIAGLWMAAAGGASAERGGRTSAATRC